jgi:nucleoside-diphosphate-sugar epimerase
MEDYITEYNMSKILVTGAAGLIGRKLCEQLGTHHEVIGVDNNQRFKNVKPLNCEFVQDDVKNFVESNKNNFDIIYHMAATNGTTSFYKNPTDVLYNNTTVDLAVFKFAEKNPNTKIIYGSSSEIISGIKQFPSSEINDAFIENIHNPRWSYRLPKIQAENYLVNSNLNYIIIRFFNVYSENTGEGHFIRDIINKISLNNFTLIGGHETRSFCYVNDAVDAMISIQDLSCEIINIGSEEEISIVEAANVIASSLGIHNITWEMQPSLQGSCQRRCPDISKLKQVFPDYSPRKFDEIIPNIIEELKNDIARTHRTNLEHRTD